MWCGAGHAASRKLQTRDGERMERAVPGSWSALAGCEGVHEAMVPVTAFTAHLGRWSGGECSANNFYLVTRYAALQSC